MQLQRKNRLKFSGLVRFPGIRVLTWDKDYLYVSKGYTLFRINTKGVELNELKLEEVASFNPDFVRKTASKNRILRRLFRTGFHSVRILPNSRIIGIVAKNIVILEFEGKEFMSTFKIKRGTRPLGMGLTPDGKIYWGEYFDNPQRNKVHIYGSEDGGYTWKIVYTFPQRTIRHIHNIFYDHYDNCFWVLTGDEEKEPRIVKASLDWKRVDVVLEGGQQERVATMILRENDIFYATDTPHEQNYIYRMNRKTGKTERVFSTPGPSMWCTEIDNIMFFSTASERGEAYCNVACVYGGFDGNKWQKLVEWSKDSLHPKYFQFGNAILPYGKNSSNLLAATGVAMKSEDEVTSIWRIEKF